MFSPAIYAALKYAEQDTLERAAAAHRITGDRQHRPPRTRRPLRLRVHVLSRARRGAATV